jgi:hypothetical protein
VTAKGYACSLPLGTDDMLAGDPSRRQRQEQRPQPDRADLGAMILLRWLAAVFVMLAVAGCTQMATEQEQAQSRLSS